MMIGSFRLSTMMLAGLRSRCTIAVVVGFLQGLRELADDIRICRSGCGLSDRMKAESG